MAAAGWRVPLNWAEVIDLARTSGRVAVPLKPIDALSLFLTLCANQGGPPLDASTGTVVEPDLGAHVLNQMSELVGVVGRGCLSLNPIDLLTTMSATDEILYCPHAYGYSNYSRHGYAPRRVTFGAFPGPSEPWSVGTTLGGAGLAVSSRCRALSAAVDYLTWVAGEECQRSTYVFAGGQPGHAAAWDDDLANEITGEFFRRTRSTIDRTFVRPRHLGMHAFQAAAGATLRSFLDGERDAVRTLELLEESFLDSLLPGERSAAAGGA
jgi:multiple sugar transport system substrate-binding protein